MKKRRQVFMENRWNRRRVVTNLYTAASLMINGGYSLYAVQRILRHSSSAVTEKYVHLSTRSLQDASDTISEQLLRAASGEN